MDPNGRVALVTGGARIGQVVAAALANRGCSLALTYRDSRGAEEIAKTVMFFVETDFVTGEFIRVDGGRHLF